MVLRCMVSYCIVVPLGKKVSIGQQIIKKGGIGPQIKAEFRDKKQWVISQSLASGLDPQVLVLHLILILPHAIINHYHDINTTIFLCIFPSWQQWWSLSKSKTEMFTFWLVTHTSHIIAASYSFLQKVTRTQCDFNIGSYHHASTQAWWIIENRVVVFFNRQVLSLRGLSKVFGREGPRNGWDYPH